MDKLLTKYTEWIGIFHFLSCNVRFLLVSPNTTNKQISIVILVVVYYQYLSIFVFKKSGETTAFRSLASFMKKIRLQICGLASGKQYQYRLATNTRVMCTDLFKFHSLIHSLIHSFIYSFHSFNCSFLCLQGKRHLKPLFHKASSIC